MANSDIIGNMHQNGFLEVCYLVEDAARITNQTFKVWVPSVMGGIDNSSLEVKNTKIDAKININSATVTPTQLQEKGYIEAYNVTPYAYRLDGYIPNHKTAKIHVARGTWSTGNVNLSGPTTAAGCGPHTHETTGTHQATSCEFSDMNLEGIEYWNSTEVDYQNINNKIIKKGHKMYGSFVNGDEPGTFIIIAIDHVVPRFNDTAVGADEDRADTSLDGDKLVKNSEMP